MSRQTRLQPWIQDYVIGIAEQQGTDYFNAPIHKKSKTVQIIEVFIFSTIVMGLMSHYLTQLTRFFFLLRTPPPQVLSSWL